MDGCCISLIYTLLLGSTLSVQGPMKLKSNTNQCISWTYKQPYRGEANVQVCTDMVCVPGRTLQLECLSVKSMQIEMSCLSASKKGLRRHGMSTRKNPSCNILGFWRSINLLLFIP